MAATENQFITWLKKAPKRYFLDALSAMALGLFSSLIIGLIISQFARIPGLAFLTQFTDIVKSGPVVGAAIGVACAWGLKVVPLAQFSAAATGAFGYSLGGPVGAYIGAVVGAEFGQLIAGKTKVDIVLVPIVSILAGCLAGKFVGPGVSALMTGLGNFINTATELQPLPMGIIVSVVVGMVLTAPISSAALAISMGLSGLAGGAATVGCCCQMIGFAVMSYSENGVGGLLAQGLGTSMLQVPNIIKRPLIWIPPTLASAILGPVSTLVMKMTNTPEGAGMGTSGLVGQFGTWASMSETMGSGQLLLNMGLLHFVLPALLTLGIAWVMRKMGWIKPGEMTLKL